MTNSSDGLGAGDEPRVGVLPATHLVAVGLAAAAYRPFDPITTFVIAPNDDPYRYFLAKERSIAIALDTLGLPVLSVAERRLPPRSSETGDRDGRNKRPEAVTVDRRCRIEFKTVSVHSFERIQKEARRASLKARRAVIDLRNGDMTVPTATVLLKRLAGSLGNRLDEVGLLLNDQTLVAWSRWE